MTKKAKGWRKETARHSLAARGIKTGRKKARPKYWKGVHANQPKSDYMTPAEKEAAKKEIPKLRQEIIKELYQPPAPEDIKKIRKNTPDLEQLEITVPRDKMHLFKFMAEHPKKYKKEAPYGMGRSKVNVKGDWVSHNAPPKSWDKNAKNTVIKVQFTETKNDKKGKALIEKLNRYNELVVGEQLLYSKTIELGESSL